VQLKEAVGSDGHSFREGLRGKAIRDGQDPLARSDASKHFSIAHQREGVQVAGASREIVPPGIHVRYDILGP
jgi:hypothetical protein